MSLVRRITSAFFTALPGAFFLFLVIATPGMRREYYWITIFVAVLVLFGSALVLGFLQPSWLRPKWFWIIAMGFVALLLALFVTAILNVTPLCVGQDNGDGNNSFGMCMGYVVLYAVFYGIPYMVLLTVSAVIGHWVMNRGLRL